MNDTHAVRAWYCFFSRCRRRDSTWKRNSSGDSPCIHGWSSYRGKRGPGTQVSSRPRRKIPGTLSWGGFFFSFCFRLDVYGREGRWFKVQYTAVEFMRYDGGGPSDSRKKFWEGRGDFYGSFVVRTLLRERWKESRREARRKHKMP